MKIVSKVSNLLLCALIATACKTGDKSEGVSDTLAANDSGLSQTGQQKLESIVGLIMGDLNKKKSNKRTLQGYYDRGYEATRPCIVQVDNNQAQLSVSIDVIGDPMSVDFLFEKKSKTSSVEFGNKNETLKAYDNRKELTVDGSNGSLTFGISTATLPVVCKNALPVDLEANTKPKEPRQYQCSGPNGQKEKVTLSADGLFIGTGTRSKVLDNEACNKAKIGCFKFNYEIDPSVRVDRALFQNIDKKGEIRLGDYEQQIILSCIRV